MANANIEITWSSEALESMRRFAEAVEKALGLLPTLMDFNEVNGNSDYPSLGPEMFTNRARNIIVWKGQEYYKPCGLFVADLKDGGQCFCILPVLMEHASHLSMSGQTRYAPLGKDGDETSTEPV